MVAVSLIRVQIKLINDLIFSLDPTEGEGEPSSRRDVGNGGGGCLISSGFPSHQGKHQPSSASCCSQDILWNVVATGIPFGIRPRKARSKFSLQGHETFVFLYLQSPTTANPTPVSNRRFK